MRRQRLPGEAASARLRRARQLRHGTDEARRESGQPRAERAVTMAIPDLLYRQPRLAIDATALLDLLGLGFLGKDLGGALSGALAAAEPGEPTWDASFFEHDLFVAALVDGLATLDVGGSRYPANRAFLRKVLARVPRDPTTTAMRQGVLRELDDSPTLLRELESLYRQLFALLSLFGTPGYQGSLDTSAIHLEILKQSKLIFDRMSERFADAESALHRLHEAGAATQSSDAYATLAALLEYEQDMARLDLEVQIGGDGKIRRVRVGRVRERDQNRFHRSPWKRLRARLRFLAAGYDFSNKELMKRLVDEVFHQISPALIPLIQLLGHLEFYLVQRAFRRQARERGLEVTLADVGDGNVLRLQGLFNPLLLAQAEAPVPCGMEITGESFITLITGPNSGGKTRLLQALAWAQLLGQSGGYAPAQTASLRPASGLFVSLVENETADQTEGRLGRELVRIRTLFERIESGSVVILDELCSGTNPSEGVEVFSMVLRLLNEVDPRAFVTTHFLDFARALELEPPVANLRFLRVELDEDQVSTYQFVGGVAPTSLAALTAARLGVTFENLSAKMRDKT